MTNPGFEATIQYAHAAIRGSFLLNGGSCISLLAFFGNKEIVTFCNLNASQCSLSTSLILFAYGALFAVITSGLSYISQGHDSMENTKYFHYFRNIAVIFYCSSLILFACGIQSAYSTLSKIGI